MHLSYSLWQQCLPTETVGAGVYRAMGYLKRGIAAARFRRLAVHRKLVKFQAHEKNEKRPIGPRAHCMPAGRPYWLQQPSAQLVHALLAARISPYGVGRRESAKTFCTGKHVKVYLLLTQLHPRIEHAKVVLLLKSHLEHVD